jgi:hypothetical protein
MDKHEPPRDKDFRMLSEAVQAWYRYYEVAPDEQASHTLCSAAIDLFNEGYRTCDGIATMLIGTYVGRWSTRVNAPTSQSIH